MLSNEFASKVASLIVSQIAESCERIEIVGSLRRGKPSVSDIDLIAIPKFQLTTDDTLFGEPVKENLLDRKLSELCLETQLILELNGAKIKRFLKPFGGVMVPVDLYMATAATWWTLLLIRTGSREHNIRLALRAQELHMQLKADGTGLLSPGGSTIQIDSEQGIFNHLRWPFRDPKERS